MKLFCIRKLIPNTWPSLSPALNVQCTFNYVHTSETHVIWSIVIWSLVYDIFFYMFLFYWRVSFSSFKCLVFFKKCNTFFWLTIAHKHTKTHCFVKVLRFQLFFFRFIKIKKKKSFQKLKFLFHFFFCLWHKAFAFFFFF